MVSAPFRGQAWCKRVHIGFKVWGLQVCKSIFPGNAEGLLRFLKGCIPYIRLPSLYTPSPSPSQEGTAFEGIEAREISLPVVLWW